MPPRVGASVQVVTGPRPLAIAAALALGVCVRACVSAHAICAETLYTLAMSCESASWSSDGVLERCKAEPTCTTSALCVKLDSSCKFSLLLCAQQIPFAQRSWKESSVWCVNIYHPFCQSNHRSALPFPFSPNLVSPYHHPLDNLCKGKHSWYVLHTVAANEPKRIIKPCRWICP